MGYKDKLKIELGKFLKTRDFESREAETKSYIPKALCFCLAS